MTSLDTRKHSPGECLRQIGGLPPKTWVSIVDDRPLSRFRLRRLVRRSDLVVERELIVVPSLEAPLAVVEDTEWAVTTYWRTVTVRSVRKSFGARTAWALLPITISRYLPWSWTGLLSPQRVVLARRR